MIDIASRGTLQMRDLSDPANQTVEMLLRDLVNLM